MSTTANVELDPYTADAENHDLTPQKKIDGLREIIKTTKTAMLTTRAPNGTLHSRAMTPASPKHGDHGLHFIFLGNNASHKFNEIENDSNVNVSFYDHSSTDWASVSGIAKVSQDRKLIQDHWSTFVSAYFGDLGDGIHKGDASDPRISVIEVIPDEIRYWVSTSNSIGKAAHLAYGAITGKGNAPGELRTITSQEIQLVEGLHNQTH
ncbi:hypothetical protein SISNIDRAFT_472508 [Sistotremastrum niveocremeum HHB9708]|uniref:General stress protein FMN-binding split barrel domain-containing protein n=2 Tax=Sistotremastraceae TaxID=3402574 RepID=A0A165AAE1_9AGAM|nr:hypothetical protein SISNIDRAFT_472508 [Sistotremastrum niveocremeum HHB9708]KZT42472.1 hypothetical protein SISSUDRAFT_1069411 [Sistotremastrum suecicum HHB10207 ss-3]